MWAAYLVLIISLIPTVVAYKRVVRFSDSQDQERLQRIIQVRQDLISRRLQRHLDVIHRQAGSLGRPRFDVTDWQSNLENAATFQNHDALRSISYFAVNIDPPTTNDVEVPFENRSLRVRTIKTVSAPGAINAPGHDLGKLTNLISRAAETMSDQISMLEQIHEIPATKKVQVMQLVTPVGLPKDGKESIQGFVGATLQWEPLLAPSTDDESPLSVALSAGEDDTSTSAQLDFAGLAFTLHYAPHPSFYEVSPRRLSNYVLFGGLFVNLMLFSIAWMQAKARYQAEQLTNDLRAIQDRDRMLERATNDAIWDWDIQGHKLAWNEAVQAMFRYSAEQVGNTIDWWLERLHPDDRRRVWNGRETAYQTGGEFWADEYRFRRGDGSYASVIDRGYIMHDRQGLAVRMIGSMVDITQQKEAEEARQESERKLALHVQQTPLAVIEWDLDFKVTAWNPAAERIFGYTSSEAIGKSGSALIVHDLGQNPNPFLFSNLLAGEAFPEDIRRKVNETWQEVLNQAAAETARGSRISSRSINAFAVANRTKTGDAIMCDWYNTPLIDANGQVVGIASLVLDVSARKEAENALAEEKERLAVTLRSIGDGVIATDTEGRINLINKLAEELTGWSQDKAMGQPLSKVFNVVDKKTRSSYRNPLSHVLSSGEIVDLPDGSVLVSRNLTEKLIAASAAPIHDQDSMIVGSVLVFRDITDEQTIVQERLRSSKLDSLGILAGGIAHDFNNILTAVIGNISFARMFSEPGDKQHDRLEEAEKAAMRAKDLATQLLTFSKGGTPVRQTASLPELIQDSTAFALRGSNVRCEFNTAPDLCTVEVDQGQISQVINNLIINAVQAMPKGGIVKVDAQNVAVDADSNLPLAFGSYARITVKDHGKGIDAEDLPHIFDPYFTTKEKGTGLGLATSYSIVKRHDGIITVDSTIGEGTEFHTYLPASEKELQTTVHTDDEPLDGQGNILVMDDEEIIRELAVTSLEYLGYDVTAVEDGESCIASYQEAMGGSNPFDIVIMDLTIPGGMGGVEAIQRLRELDPNVTAIVSSGYSSGPVLANYEKHGFKGVVAKPYKIEDLAKELANLMNDPERRSTATEA